MLAVVEDALAGRACVLPVPADDERQTSVLTTSLRAGEEIDDDVAVVMPTSGTTGVPKGAMLTAAALMASAEATYARLGGPGRWLLALPAYHVAGLQVLVRSVVAGVEPIAVSASFDTGELASAVASLGSSRLIGRDQLVEMFDLDGQGLNFCVELRDLNLNRFNLDGFGIDNIKVERHQRACDEKAEQSNLLDGRNIPQRIQVQAVQTHVSLSSKDRA